MGSSGLLARMGLGGGMDALQLALWRLTVAGGLLLLWQAIGWRSRGRHGLRSGQMETDLARRLQEINLAAPVKSAMPRREQARLVVAGACLAFHFVTWFASLNYVPIARSTLLVTTSPLWAGLLGWFVPGLRVGRGFGSGWQLRLGRLSGDNAGRGTARTNGVSGWRRMERGYAGNGRRAAHCAVLAARAARAGRVRHTAAVTWAYSCAAACLWLVALPQGHGAFTADTARVGVRAGDGAGSAIARTYCPEPLPPPLFCKPGFHRHSVRAGFCGDTGMAAAWRNHYRRAVAGAALLLCGVAQTLRVGEHPPTCLHLTRQQIYRWNAAKMPDA